MHKASLKILTAAARSARLAQVYGRVYSTPASQMREDYGETKPFSQIPIHRGLPIIGTALDMAKHIKETHKLIQRRHEELGPIFHEKTPMMDIVFVNDIDAVEQLLRQDGKYPERLQLDIWLDYRRRHGIPMGLVMSDGEEWYKMRRLLEKPLLKIRTVNSYASELNCVVDEFVDRMYHVRKTDNSIPDLDEELFGWSLESMSRILYERRLGCLSDERDPDTQAYIDCIHDVFESSNRLQMLPPNLARIFMNKIWQKHEDAWDTGFKYANRVIEEKLQEIESAGEDGEVGFLATFVKESSASRQEIYSNVSELMGAGVDTTSNAVQMMLYEMSRNPDVQQTILEEVNRVVPRGEQATSEHLKDMHYVKAVIKETLRMYPTVPMVFRKLPNDINLLGYNIPKRTPVAIHLYVLGRSHKYFTDHNSFKPERWLRKEGHTPTNPFAWLPFGFGPRMCIGRRVAELEMQLLISQLVRKFKIEAVSDTPVDMKTDLVLVPDGKIQIRLLDRP